MKVKENHGHLLVYASWPQGFIIGIIHFNHASLSSYNLNRK